MLHFGRLPGLEVSWLPVSGGGEPAISEGYQKPAIPERFCKGADKFGHFTNHVSFARFCCSPPIFVYCVTPSLPAHHRDRMRTQLAEVSRRRSRRVNWLASSFDPNADSFCRLLISTMRVVWRSVLLGRGFPRKTSTEAK